MSPTVFRSTKRLVSLRNRNIQGWGRYLTRAAASQLAPLAHCRTPLPSLRKALPQASPYLRSGWSPSSFTTFYLDIDLSASMSSTFGALSRLPSLSIVSIVLSVRSSHRGAETKCRQRRDVRVTSNRVAFICVAFPSKKRAVTLFYLITG